jgi:hypothetical protein
MQKAFSEVGVSSEVRILDVDNQGLEIEQVS